MVIKPHLAVGFGLWTLIAGHWRMAMVAWVTISLCCAASFMVFGGDAWRAFATAATDTGSTLTSGDFLLFRMSSVYATGLSLGLTSSTAMAVHFGVFLLACVIVFRLRTQGVPMRVFMGFGLILSALFSPYTYDYDLVVLLVAAALMLEPLNARATAIEKTLIWAGFWVLGSYSFAITILSDVTGVASHDMPSLLGPVVVMLAGLALRAALRPCPEPLSDTSLRHAQP